MCIRDRDKGLKYVSSSHNGVYDEVAHTVTWVVDIAAGSSFDLTVTAVADEYGCLLYTSRCV